MRKIPAFHAVLAGTLLLSLCAAAGLAGEIQSRPRLLAGGDGLWAGFQSTASPDGPRQYVVRHFNRAQGTWFDLGRFNGELAGLAADDEGGLWMATRDGALVRLEADQDESPAALPDNRWNLLDLAWIDGGVAALHYRDGAFKLVRPDGDRSWGREEAIAANLGQVSAAVLVNAGGTCHLLWRGDNGGLAGGAVGHLVRANGRWREEAPIPLGGVAAFAAFAESDKIRLAAKTVDLLGRRRPPQLVNLVLERGVWRALGEPPEPVRAALAGAFDFAATPAKGGTSWLTTGPGGVTALRPTGEGRYAETALAGGFDEAFAWSNAVTLLFFLLMVFLLGRTCRKSRQLSRSFPGRPADIMSRAVAVFIDGFVASIGVAAYHLTAGDLNIYEEFFNLGMMNEAFWINLAGLAALAAVCEGAWGRTPGKWLMGIRVRSAAGGPPGAFQAVSRNILRGVDMFPTVFPGLVGAVAMFLNKRRQRIGDIVAGTLVRRHAPLKYRRIILASGSPRRKELLEALGLGFTVVAPGIDEDAVVGNSPADTARLLAEAKAEAIAPTATTAGEIVIAADTMVVVDDEVLGKPLDAEDAKRMLGLLSGRSHKVISGVSLRDTATGECFSDVEETEVEFRSLSREEIDSYVASGDPLDKAGAYGIQSGYLVKQVRGSLSNVAGLPMELLRDMLDSLDS